jgi:hypothetical protein
MKTTNTAVASLAALLVAFGNSFADLPPPSDAFSMFDPSGHRSIFLEYYENGDSSFVDLNGFHTAAPPGGSLVFTGVLGAAGMIDAPLFLLDASGSLADVFGIFQNPANEEYEIAFVANSMANPITLVPPPGTVL